MIPCIRPPAVVLSPSSLGGVPCRYRCGMDLTIPPLENVLRPKQDPVISKEEQREQEETKKGRKEGYGLYFFLFIFQYATSNNDDDDDDDVLYTVHWKERERDSEKANGFVEYV
mmetsp:Transcript_21269/g.32557  ORF Transcript_21269/g.32557 Transcript_21269/m.32557 type:complete len:114 (-) Transcript_21269:263-604(-)